MEIFMKNYQNARDVLPAELLRELRRYHTGALYVPAGDSKFEREALVISMHERGATRKEISHADFFGGSGSTLIAAEQTGRKAYLMELDEKYCDVIRKRWAEFVHGEGCGWVELSKQVTGSK